MGRAGEVAEVDAAAGDAWAASGAMALTGWPHDPPLGPPAPLVGEVRALGDALAVHARRAGRRIGLDPLALLGERAALAGLRRRGRTSCGGGARLLRARDGWLAVSLTRPDDVDLLPAWLGDDPARFGADPWPAVAAAVTGQGTEALLEAALVLGLPVAGLGRHSPQAAVRRHAAHAPSSPAPSPPAGLRVVDLSALWAGPLCASLLGALGADVVKVESTQRPDGARRGPSAFDDLLNAGKRSVAVDLTTDEGRRALQGLVAGADVVVEASRPRALRSLGVDAERLLASARPRVWVSITGHGRTGAGADRVAFGDDAAVAGGLVAWDAADEPVFCADAVADPLTGLRAAVAALDALADGGRWLLDVSMAAVAASVAGPTVPVPPAVEPAPPRARASPGAARALGADTAAVLRDA